MTKYIGNKENLNFLLENLKLNNENFTTVVSGSSFLINDNGYFYRCYANKLTNLKGFYFIKKFQKYIKDNNINYNFNSKITYQKLNPFLKLNKIHIKDIFEIDLKSAYWRYALKNGFINNEIYEEGLKIPKLVRLIALGSLAKVTYTFNYVNGKANKPIIEHSLNSGIFFKCSYDTDRILKELVLKLNKEQFLFYWVDAIFVKGIEAKTIIENYLKNHLIEFKTIPLKSVCVKKTHVSVYGKKGKKELIYNFKKAMQ